MILTALPAIALTACHASDGDTISCRGIRYRLLAVSAADSPRSSPCRNRLPGYVCDEALYRRDKATLARFIRRGRLTWQHYKTGAYRRSTGILRVGGRSANCYMIRHGAIYVPRYDRGGLVRRECLR